MSSHLHSLLFALIFLYHLFWRKFYSRFLAFSPPCSNNKILMYYCSLLKMFPLILEVLEKTCSFLLGKIFLSTSSCWLSDQLLFDHHEFRLHIIQRSVRCHSRTSPRSLNSRPTCWPLVFSNTGLSTRLQHVYHTWTCLIAARDLLSTQRSDSPMWIVRSFCWFAAVFFDSMTAWCC